MPTSIDRLTPQMAALALNSSPEQLAAAANAMAQSRDDQDVKNKTYDDVKDLAVTIRTLRQAFLQAAHEIRIFDETGLGQRDGYHIQLYPEWVVNIKVGMLGASLTASR